MSKPAGTPLRKFFAHQVFPGGQHRPQKFRFIFPLGLGDEEVPAARGYDQPFPRDGGGDPARHIRGR